MHRSAAKEEKKKKKIEEPNGSFSSLGSVVAKKCEPKTEPSRETNGDLKRKQSEEQNHPSKFPRSSDKPSPSNKKEGDGFKKPKSLKEVVHIGSCVIVRSFLPLN
ncbi:hypothetical protein F2Q70_00007811 [Brassica cretica]|uniref:Uncharacterized protein n=1 Tax=Brassica cretica TaxID=69181 RepID=A0A8S9MBS2_BRACR|nr:hypothetical protein F2Q70_00007811 [Brassica cretica]